MQKKIKKAIIPVAGMGTRFLPATKAQPKEMLTIVDKPVIQYIVEEAVESGIEEIIFVTAIGKRAIEDHFDRNFELEYRLEQRNKHKELDEIRKIGRLAKFAFVRQSKPLGDGHAVLSAESFVAEDEAVAVLFGDDVTVGKRPATKELIETFEKYQKPVVGVQEVPKDKVSNYGIISGERIDSKTLEVKKFIEKPTQKSSPSNTASSGRYILTPDIFKVLKKQKPGKDGEIRLADAFVTYLKQGGLMFSREFESRRYDCGNKLQFVIAQIELGLKHPEIKKELQDYLKKIKN